MTQELESLAQELSLPYYDDALPAHDQFHAKRVRDLSVQLADVCEKPLDQDVLSAAAWLHDIGRPQERMGKIENHDQWAAGESARLLTSESIPLNQVEAIEHCLRSHSIRTTSLEPETLEAKLLFDADKLDALGAHGLIRLACIVGERSGRTRERYAVLDDPSALGMELSDDPDISLLQDWAKERLDALYTAPGRQIGTARWEFMDDFFVQFEKEI